MPRPTPLLSAVLAAALASAGCLEVGQTRGAPVADTDPPVDTEPPADDEPEAAEEAADDEGDETEAAPEAPPPTPYTDAATKAVDDIVFAKHGGKRIFALGFDTKRAGPWDGVADVGECKGGEDGAVTPGRLPTNGIEMTRLCAAAGANFAYVWGYGSPANTEMYQNVVNTRPQLYGIFNDGWGRDRPKENDVIPIVVNAYGESDIASPAQRPIKAAEMKADFEAFKARTGRWSPQNKPNLPGFDEVPWLAWHPSWRSRGGGTGDGETLSDDQVRLYTSAVNHHMGNNYSYVWNRSDSKFNPLTGQKGEQGEGYDDWLAWKDPEHATYLSAAWDLGHGLRRLSPPDSLVWLWMQGHAFDDDIGGQCGGDRASDLWARGPFPTRAYLRKELASLIAAGGTGFIHFGMFYGRGDAQWRARSYFTALADAEVYEPALLSPRLDLGRPTINLGTSGDVHFIAKWHAPSKTAFLIGANVSADLETVTFEFPWTAAAAEVYNWEETTFEPSPDARVFDKTVTLDVESADGVIVRVRPYTLD